MMTPTAEQTAPHIARFLDMLDAAFNGVVPRRPEIATPGTCSSATSA
jgi:hypothetical protein